MLAFNAHALGEPILVGLFRTEPDFDWSDREGLWLFRTKDDDEVVSEFLTLQDEKRDLREEFFLTRRSIYDDVVDTDFDLYDPSVPRSYIAGLIQHQWRGNKGPLLTSGYGNRFVCKDFIVNVYRHRHASRWIVYPWRRGIYRWRNPGEAFTNK